MSPQKPSCRGHCEPRVTAWLSARQLRVEHRVQEQQREPKPRTGAVLTTRAGPGTLLTMIAAFPVVERGWCFDACEDVKAGGLQ